MDYIAYLQHSKDFAWGCLVTGVLMLFLMFYAAALRAHNLLLSYQAGRSTKIGKHFYYLVRGEDYVKMRMAVARIVATPEFTQPVEEAIPFVLHTESNVPGWTDYYSEFKGSPCRGTDIRAAKFYWSETDAEADQEKLRDLYSLTVQRDIYIDRIDDLDMDDLAYKMLMDRAHSQRTATNNQLTEQEHEH
ncbi:hypothetical protein [Paraburkholderia sp. BCC1886]|uniref:hypothetical protein n=1 Tax=Paraburkholderia sp. BCC1886 TaxID=2562670 RepID=UPI0011827985|nr:hypothetical protein [Paraburkholderia sp. BCC1886]